MSHFEILEPIISNTEDTFIKDFICNSVRKFYEELDIFCYKNSTYDFCEWFSENTFLSVFFNGIVRNDIQKLYSVIQEYCVKMSKRCDGYLVCDKNAVLIEAKMQRFSNRVDVGHFDIDTWITWDESVNRSQLSEYFELEKDFFMGHNRFNECYLMTLVFKEVRENAAEHFAKAKNCLLPSHINDFQRTWYYSCAFIKDPDVELELLNGLEVYGTIKKYEK